MKFSHYPIRAESDRGSRLRRIIPGSVAAGCLGDAKTQLAELASRGARSPGIGSESKARPERRLCSRAITPGTTARRPWTAINETKRGTGRMKLVAHQLSPFSLFLYLSPLLFPVLAHPLLCPTFFVSSLFSLASRNSFASLLSLCCSLGSSCSRNLCSLLLALEFSEVRLSRGFPASFRISPVVFFLRIPQIFPCSSVSVIQHSSSLFRLVRMLCIRVVHGRCEIRVIARTTRRMV